MMLGLLEILSICSFWPRVRAAMLTFSESQARQRVYGRCVFTLERHLRDNVTFLSRIASRLVNAEELYPGSVAEVAVAKLLSGNLFSDSGSFNRRLIPPALTDGVEAFVTGFAVNCSRLPSGFDPGDINSTILKCRVQPDRDGAIVVLRSTDEDVVRNQEERLSQVSEHGVRVIAALVQANNKLYLPGTSGSACLVLLTFDTRLRDAGDYLMQLARRVFELKDTEPEPPDLRYVASLVTNEAAVYHRRRRLPASFTRGPTVYAAELWIHRSDLRYGYIRNEQLLDCIAEPGDDGGIELVPHWYDQTERS